MIDFSLSQEERAVRDTIRQFITRDVMPLEPQVLRNERRGLPPLEPGQLKDLQLRAKAGGWWGINTPAEYGGIALGPVMSAIVAMETGRTFVPFAFGGSAATSCSPGPKSSGGSISSPRSTATDAAASRSPSPGRDPTPATSGPGRSGTAATG